jgi:hypothetical protein
VDFVDQSHGQDCLRVAWASTYLPDQRHIVGWS